MIRVPSELGMRLADLCQIWECVPASLCLSSPVRFADLHSFPVFLPTSTIPARPQAMPAAFPPVKDIVRGYLNTEADESEDDLGLEEDEGESEVEEEEMEDEDDETPAGTSNEGRRRAAKRGTGVPLAGASHDISLSYL